MWCVYCSTLSDDRPSARAVSVAACPTLLRRHYDVVDCQHNLLDTMPDKYEEMVHRWNAATVDEVK